MTDYFSVHYSNGDHKMVTSSHATFTSGDWSRAVAEARAMSVDWGKRYRVGSYESALTGQRRWVASPAESRWVST